LGHLVLEYLLAKRGQSFRISLRLRDDFGVGAIDERRARRFT